MFVIAAIVLIWLSISKRVKPRHRELLFACQRILGGDWHLRKFYGQWRLIAMQQEHHITLKIIQQSARDTNPLQADTIELQLGVRVKIQASKHQRIHLTLLSKSSKAIHKVAGWQRVEEDLYLADSRKASLHDGRACLAQFQPDTILALRQHNQRYNGNLSITPDWESTLLGQENALAICNGNQELLQCLDLHAMYSIPIEADPFHLFLEELIAVSDQISKDLNTNLK